MIEKLRNEQAQAAQRIQTRQLWFMLSVSILHTFTTLFFYLSDNMRLQAEPLLAFFALIWLINIGLLTGYKKNLTSRLKDPVLTVQMMLWLSACILFTAYHMKDFRLSMLMLLLGVLILGAFSVRFRNYLLVVLFIITGYSIVLFQLVNNFGEFIDLTVEVIEFALFILVNIGMLVTVTRIAKLQNGLLQQGNRLTEALEKVHDLSIRDELTGLYNRRKIMELLRDEVNLAKTGDYNFVVCYLDLDKFKSINDTFGHALGDEVIKRFSQIALKSIRSIDYAGRIGGEEFLLVLTNTKMDECLLVAERVRAAMEKEHFAGITDRDAVTVSIGAAQFRIDETLETLLGRADAALYQAKENGRNQVVKA